MKQLQLLPPSMVFTDGDQQEVIKVFAAPIAQRFLRTRLWNTVIDHANIPLADLCTEEGKLRAAYFKGSIAVLDDLLSMVVQDEANRLATQQINES